MIAELAIRLERVDVPPEHFEQADRDTGGLFAQFARGDFAPLRRWLVETIHRQGRRYTASQLVERVTGASLSHDALMRHLRGKFEPLYGL